MQCYISYYVSTFVPVELSPAQPFSLHIYLLTHRKRSCIVRSSLARCPPPGSPLLIIISTTPPPLTVVVASCQAAVSHSTKVLKFWLDVWLAGWPWRWCQVLLSFVILRAHSLWVLLLLLFSEDFCGKRDYIIIQPVTQQQQARTG